MLILAFKFYEMDCRRSEVKTLPQDFCLSFFLSLFLHSFCLSFYNFSVFLSTFFNKPSVSIVILQNCLLMKVHDLDYDLDWWREKRVVSSGHSRAFYVIFVPLEYIPTTPAHYNYIIDFLLREHVNPQMSTFTRTLNVVMLLVYNCLLWHINRCYMLQISSFFTFFAQKMLKMTILTSVWCAQHPKAGQNIQHILHYLLVP